jgi:prepilin-type N-terminal cleavage/methylation domain-containing protein
MKNNAGFTLLEIMVALTLLAIGIIAVLQLFPQSLRQSRIAAEKTTVANLAQTELSRVRAGGVGEALTNWATRNALKELTSAQKAYSLYESWRSTVQRVGGDVDLYRVTFSVTMFDGREEKFVTYVTEE